MINAYQNLIEFDGDDWENYLTKICLIDIFKDLIPLFKDKSALTQAIRYVVWTYSKDSECVILDMDWLSNKKKIFDKCMLHHDYYNDVVLLGNRIVINVIQNWVDFQDNNTYANLMALKDLMIEMRLSSNSNIKKTDGITTDFDQKFKNAQYVFDLEKMIKDLEQELIQNDLKLKEGVREIKKASKSHSIGVEKYAV